MAKVGMTLEKVLESDFREINKLLKTWQPLAKEDEGAVGAMVKLMERREKIVRSYLALKPPEETSVDRFVKQHEERRGKTSRNIR